MMPSDLQLNTTTTSALPDQYALGVTPIHSSQNEIHEWLDSLSIPALNKICPAGSLPSHCLKTKREQEFLLGRECAESQLHAWGEYSAVEVNEDRSPAWPQGFVGSISHSDKWVWASVARDVDLRSIGIDTEIVADAKTENQLRTEIATEKEWKTAAKTGLNPRQQFSVVFSAKEAFYKCWYPINPRYFDFADAIVTSASRKRLTIKTARSNPNFGTQPKELNIYFFVNKNEVFTITWMEHK